jgi:hypothetical protein
MTSACCLHDFVMYLLNTDFGKPHAYREPICTSENYQWRGEPYFAVSAISIGGMLPQIPRQGKHKSLQI